MKKLISFSLALLLSYSFVNAQLNGNYGIGWGADDDYTTLFQALQDLQSQGADGPVVFELSADYDHTPEAYPVNITNFPGSSEQNTLTISMAPGCQDTLTRDNAVAVVYIHDAQHIIIDGSNGGETKDLFISNTSSDDDQSAVVVENSSHITIKNCIISAGGKEITSAGIYGLNADNVFVHHNEISHAQIGIKLEGNNNQVTDNLIGSEQPEKYLDYGIYCLNGENAIVSGNTVFNLIDNDLYNSVEAIRAIAMENLSGEIVVDANYIDSLIHTGSTNVAQGIAVRNCNTTVFRISNNRISHIASDALDNDMPCGIAIDAPDLSGLEIIHNSIHMPPSPDYGLLGSGTPLVAGGILINQITDLSMKNNIISNSMGSRNGSTNFNVGVAVGINFSSNPFSEIDNNLYYADGNYSVTGVGASSSGIFYTLGDWQSYTGDDNFSLADESPNFISDDALQLQASSHAIARAEYLPDYPTDIEGITRNPDYPSLGCYSYEIIQAHHLYQYFPCKAVGWVELHWEGGSGYKTAVFMKEGNFSGSPPIPENSITYNADDEFGLGDEIGSSGWYCVYNDLNLPDNFFYITAINGIVYTVMATDYFGSTGKEIYITDTAVDNPILVIGDNSGSVSEINSEFSVFPNPAKEVLYLTSSNWSVDRIRLTDISGKEIQIPQPNFERETVSLDLSALSPGIYLLQIESGTKIYSQKIVKQ